MKKARPIMIQGTMSNAGKSILCTALCRILAQDGYSVAPFKSQNMALNSYITEDGLEIGRAQAVQAEAAYKKPSADMNPILLKPTTDVGSQVIVNGRVYGNMRASEYFACKKQFIPDIMGAYERLAAENDYIVIEGAGSPAEINLKKNDIVNMGLAAMTNAPVLLVGDIDRGGVFAQLYGTAALLEPDERDRIKGLIINKFRGDLAILGSGISRIEELTGIKCVGVVPYSHADIDDEDSLSERFDSQEKKDIDIAVIRLPRISNFTDFMTFERFAGVSVRYVDKTSQLRNPDIIIIPGTKSTIHDMLWMRQNGLEAAVKKHASAGGITFGICGGLQILGNTISDECGAEDSRCETISGMELIPVDTVFANDKTQTQTGGVISGLVGMYEKLNSIPYSGYEIHMGKSGLDSAIIQNGSVLASYVHGIFDNGLDEAIINIAAQKKGIDIDTGTFDREAYRQAQYDRLAQDVRQALDMDYIYRIMNA